MLDVALLPRQLLLALSCLFGLIYLGHRQFKSTLPIIQFGIADGVFLILITAHFLSRVNATVLGEYWVEVLRVTTLYVLFVVLKNVFSNVNRSHLLKALSISFTGLVIVGFTQFVQLSDWNLHSMLSVTGRMTNKNLFAEYLVLLLPFHLAAFHYGSKLWKMLSSAAILGALLLIIAIQGRGAWMGLIMQLVVITGVLFSFSTNLQGIKRYGKQLLLAIATAVIATFSSVYLLKLDVWNRFSSIFEVGEGTAGLRIRIWTKTLELVKSEPLFGVGAGHWKIKFQEFGMSNSAETFITYALNDYVCLAAEVGVVGVVALIGLLFVACFKLIGQIHKSEEKRWIAAAALGTIVGFAVIAVFSFPWLRVEHSVLLVLALAIAFQNNENIKLKRTRNLAFVFALLGIAVSFGCLVLVRFQSETHVKNALKLRAKQNWSAVIEEVANVNLDWYPIEPSTTPIIWYSGIAHFQLGNRSGAKQDFERAYAVNPYHIHTVNNLGTCYAQEGQIEKALTYYERALEINDVFEDAFLNMIAIYMHQGNKQKVVELIDNSRVTSSGSKDFIENIRQLRLKLAGRRTATVRKETPQ